MKTTAFIEINVAGVKGNLKLAPENYDIREVISILEIADSLLFPGDKRMRPLVSYELKEGSVRHLFKTSLQYVIGFNAILGQIDKTGQIDFLDLPTAKAFESIQHVALKSNYTFTVSTSLEESHSLTIDRTTSLHLEEAQWVEAEFYLYGKVTNAGGKDRANIHLQTDDLGIIRIATPIAFLEKYDHNLLYKPFGVQVLGRQNSKSGEVDLTSFRFLRLVEYTPTYDEQYLQELRRKAMSGWLGKTDAGHMLDQLRGRYHA